MFVDLLIAISCGVVGLMCGWIAYPSVIKATSGPLRPTDDHHVSQATGLLDNPVGAADEQARLSEIAKRLSLLTASVTASVHQHANELQCATELVHRVESTRDPAILLQAMNRLLDASEIMRDQLATAENKLVEQNLLLQTAEATSFTDPLTQIANRRALDVHLEACVAESPERISTLMIVDIDHFKHFNDNYGHIAGDQILKKVAGFIQKQLGHVGIVARYGGEEFIVVFDGKAMRECVDHAEATRSLISQQVITFQERPLRVTASMGLSELLSDAKERDSAEQWLHRADRALYKSKQSRDCGHAVLSDGNVIRIHRHPSDAPSPDASSTELTSGAEDKRSANELRLPSGLAGLVSGDVMHREFDELSKGFDGVGLAFVTAVVRIDDASDDMRRLQTVARMCRTVLRSVDRIGVIDQRTLAIAMPSIDHETAVQKADRIRANMIFANDDSGRIGQSKATVSIALCSSSERPSFTEMVKVATRMLGSCHPDCCNQTLQAWR